MDNLYIIGCFLFGMRKVIFWLLISIILILVIILGGAFYYIFISWAPPSEGVVLENPASGLSTDEAVAQFDEDFVIYLLYGIGAQNLHNPPLSSNTPKVEIYVGGEVYNAEVIDNSVNVAKGSIDEEDIIMRTSTIEAVKMVQDQNYIATSFNSGSSTMELIAGKPTLFSKGYLKIYSSLTGNVVRS